MNSIVYCYALEFHVCCHSESIFRYHLPETQKLVPSSNYFDLCYDRSFFKIFSTFPRQKTCLFPVFFFFLILYVSVEDAIFDVFVHYDTHGNFKADNGHIRIQWCGYKENMYIFGRKYYKSIFVSLLENVLKIIRFMKNKTQNKRMKYLEIKSLKFESLFKMCNN